MKRTKSWTWMLWTFMWRIGEARKWEAAKKNRGTMLICKPPIAEARIRLNWPGIRCIVVVMISRTHSQSLKLITSRTSPRNSRKRISKAMLPRRSLQLPRLIAAPSTTNPTIKSHRSSKKITRANSYMIRSFRSNTSKNTWATTSKFWICTRGRVF